MKTLAEQIAMARQLTKERIAARATFVAEQERWYAEWYAKEAERQAEREKHEAERAKYQLKLREEWEDRSEKHKATRAARTAARDAALLKYRKQDWHALLPTQLADEQTLWDRNATMARMAEVGKTFVEIGAAFGVSGCRARQCVHKHARGRRSPVERYFDERPDMVSFKVLRPRPPTKAERFVSAWETYQYAA